MTEPDLAQRIAALQDQGLPGLRAEWERRHGRPPPARLSRELLIRSIAWAIQAERRGGLRPALARRLARLAEGGDASAAARAATRLQPGTRLMREWYGETQVVEVLETGFAWKGRTYRSLTAVARAITGVSWSGPRFFGLQTGSRASEADR